jgi:hypothetical protein
LAGLVPAIHVLFLFVLRAPESACCVPALPNDFFLSLGSRSFFVGSPLTRSHVHVLFHAPKSIGNV